MIVDFVVGSQDLLQLSSHLSVYDLILGRTEHSTIFSVALWLILIFRYYHTLLPGIELQICDILVVPAEKVFQEDQGFLKVVCVALS